jgi:hypothetical protein
MKDKLMMLEVYVNREINLIVEQLKESKRYQKSYLEGALSVFKKMQNKIIELKIKE